MSVGAVRGRRWDVRSILLSVSMLVAMAAPLQADHRTDQGIGLNRGQAAALIRSTLITLNDANATANYSVLHGLAAPDFQARYSVEKLTSLFEIMRTKHVDLSKTASMDPVIEQARFVRAQNIVQFQGFLPTRPARLRFGFSYQNVDGTWKLYRLDLGFEPAPGAGGQAGTTS